MHSASRPARPDARRAGPPGQGVRDWHGAHESTGNAWLLGVKEKMGREREEKQKGEAGVELA